MKKKLLWIFIILVTVTTGCNSSKIVKEELEPITIDGVSMTIKSGRLSKEEATIVIQDINGKNTYMYGTEFRIDKKEKDNWVEMKIKGKGCWFNAVGYFVGEEGTLEMNQNWECLYGKLKKGTYRLVKSAVLHSETPATEKDKKYFAVEFTID